MPHPANAVILVNEKGEWTGTMDKLEAHRVGALHRAFSVFLFRSSGEMILQRRADGKYHSGGLWTNACCSHPKPGESTLQGARRRLREELGIELQELQPVGHLRYRAEVGNDLIENEWDCLFTGIWDGEFAPEPDEASAVQALPVAEVQSWLEREPEAFTAWFGHAAKKLPRSSMQ